LRGGSGGPGTARFTECLVENNALRAAGVLGGVLHAAASSGSVLLSERLSVVVERSLFTDNTIDSSRATDTTAGLFSTRESWMQRDSTHVLVQNSTVHGNTLSGPIDATVAHGNFVFVNSTITDNLGKNVTAGARPLRGSISAHHSVFAGNTAGTLACTAADALQIGGRYNWFDHAQQCEASSDAHSTFGGDPELGPLADHGDFTWTRAPLDASPLIDAGDATCSAGARPSTRDDQRGAARPLGRACDLGSVELH
jgi:hypothetical protein